MRSKKEIATEPMELSADELDLVVGGAPTIMMVEAGANEQALAAEIRNQKRAKQVAEDTFRLMGLGSNPGLYG
jgi:polyribonucleotide nucleotidyltransferase